MRAPVRPRLPSLAVPLSSLVATLGATAAAAVPAVASPYREVDEPAGRERGTVILLHGGGWTSTGAQVTQTLSGTARTFRRWGYRTVNTDYRAGTAGLDDVLGAVDAESARGAGRVCVWGVSAGGTWALMAAARRPALRCVIAVAAPTDLVAPTFTDPDGTLAGYSRRVFGRAAPAYSPLLQAGAIDAAVLIADAAQDPVVPAVQGRALAARLRHVRRVELAPGSAAFVHSSVDPDDLRRLGRAERRWLRTTVG